MSKRSMLAKAMQWSGVTKLLESRRTKPGLLVINHHRVGNASRSRFDRAVFSASAEELQQQVRYLKQHVPVVGGAELEELVLGAKPLDRLYVAITFDDGYLDNYTHAFPVLRDLGCAASFFLVPSYVGSDTIPWWDEIAYLVRNSHSAVLSLRTPEPLTVHITGDREQAIYHVLRHYKRADNDRPQEFMAELYAASGCDLPTVGRRFLDWREAAEMQSAGMTIGSHTQTHRILAPLSLAEQREELVRSRGVMEKQLHCIITSLAYPVGGPGTFSETTEHLAKSAGYNSCYSFMGGVNIAGALNATNVLRTSVAPDQLMFRNQVVLLSRFGKLPYA